MSSIRKNVVGGKLIRHSRNRKNHPRLRHNPAQHRPLPRPVGNQAMGKKTTRTTPVTGRISSSSNTRAALLPQRLRSQISRIILSINRRGTTPATAAGRQLMSTI